MTVSYRGVSNRRTLTAMGFDIGKAVEKGS